MGSSISSIVFPAPKSSYDKTWEHFVELTIPEKESCVSSFKTSKTLVGAFYFPYPESTKAIIYSHGNGEDIGQLWALFSSLSSALKVNILCYDYIGYGVNQDTPSEQGCIDAITAAWNFLTITKEFSQCNILMYGRSIGTGPTVHLAAKLCGCKTPPLAVVLEAPYTSVIDVASKYMAQTSACVDMFKNREKITLITVPILIFHGTNDQIIPYNHSIQLRDIYLKNPIHSQCRIVSFEGGGHNLGPNHGKTMWTEVGKLLYT
jgi:fermentation-respiration switch protein FrsA (DUF1100 family)